MRTMADCGHQVSCVGKQVGRRYCGHRQWSMANDGLDAMADV